MEWSRSETLALAKQHCCRCKGEGLRPSEWTKQNPCNCVLRAIFSACYRRFRSCVQKEKFMSKVCLMRHGSRKRHAAFAFERLDEDYIADFYLVSKRALEPDPMLWGVFRLHFLLGADWRLCCGRLGIDRGLFYHAVYRIQQRLGRVFRELEPYCLFPLDEYFTMTTQRTAPCTPRHRAARGSAPVRAPLAMKVGAIAI